MENWKWIPKYEFRYEINEEGQVRGIAEGELIPRLNATGIKEVCLRKNGQTYFVPVYWLMAITFIPNPDRHKFVRMKDGNKNNLCISNLEWFTPPQKATTQQSARPQPKENPFNVPVRCIDTGKKYDSILLAAREMNIPPMFIKWLCDNNRPLPTERFEYIKEDEVEAIEV